MANFEQPRHEEEEDASWMSPSLEEQEALKREFSDEEPSQPSNLETGEKRIDFLGEDAEVTVERHSGEIEGGWEVIGPDKNGNTIVHNREKHLDKSVNTEKLLKLQPFQIGESVAVIRSSGNLETKGWTVVERFGAGKYGVLQLVDGKTRAKVLDKHDLINARIAQLEAEKANNKEIEQWKNKLKTIEAIERDRLVAENEKIDEPDSGQKEETPIR